MLTLALSACLASYVAFAQKCSKTGKEPAVNSGTNNYIIETLDILQMSIPFSYAMNQCTPHSLTGEGPYFKHFCISSTQAATQVFADSSCEGNVTEEIVLNQGNPGDVGYFECGGEDTYAKIQLGETQGTSECPELQVIYAGLGACVNVGAMNLKYSIYCDASNSKFQWFSKFNGQGRSGEDTENEGETTDAPWNSFSPWTTEAEGESDSGSDSGDFASSGVDTGVTCDSSFYCFDWVLTESCQKIDGTTSSVVGVWGLLEGCSGTSETLTGAGVHLHFNALLIAVLAIVAAWI